MEAVRPPRPKATYKVLFPLLLLACKAPSESALGSRVDSPLDSDSPVDSHSDSPVDSPIDTGPAAAPSVILFIGDGMGFAHVAGGGVYATGSSGTLAMETLPIRGQIRSGSLSGTTDSAAAATSYATGEKTWNDWLGLDRDGNPLATLLDAAKARGMSTGIVTTDNLTGATPSAFLVHNPNRHDTTDIALQEVADLPDVLLGGGAIALEPLLVDADIQLVVDAASLDAVTLDTSSDTSPGQDPPLVGLFADDVLPYVFDGLGDAPSLAQMTTAALARLGTNPNGFFLMVEGARIDHASHVRNSDEVYPEVVGFDEAIAEGMAWADGRDNVTLLVTADHECGGIVVASTGTPGETPATTWRWGAHTNADPPVFAMGERASLFDGQRLDALWVHAVLAAAVEDRDVTDPDITPLIDGWLEDVGDPVTVQTLDTDFGPGFDQLDALRLTADADGLRVGIDGTFDRSNNSVVLLFDLDFGEGTGLGGADSLLPDLDGSLEAVLSNMNVTTTVPGLGFDLAMVSVRAREIVLNELQDDGGLRGLRDPWAFAGDLWWLSAILSYDDGNVSVNDTAAIDAAATGTTLHGAEALLPWWSVWPEGLPPEGQTIAVVALIVYTDGSYPSNQALPPFETEPTDGAIVLTSVVKLTVDGDGVAVGLPEVVRTSR